ncbi:MAG: DsrE/DsrF/DrsH-like family protein [Verrucomicrobiales bacterium]|nr:DsrE/DsrF/DrsH-like family protein [Verrucomicrobiales bacterium]
MRPGEQPAAGAASREPTLEARVAGLERELQAQRREDSVSIICFSGDWDRLYAAFTIANGALALGQEVNMFFTFWGATAVRRKVDGAVRRGDGRSDWRQRMLGWMLPSGIDRAPLSKLHLCGLGKWMMGLVMRQKNLDNLPDLMADARELGVNFYYCDSSLSLFGWCPEDLMDADRAKCCGVSTFLGKSLKGRIALFI